MAAPPRGNTGHGCYFITACTFQKRSLLQSDRMKRLFVDVLFHYRLQEKYLLHEFVIMHDHFHLLISPVVTLESHAVHQGWILVSSEEGAWIHA